MDGLIGLIFSIVFIVLYIHKVRWAKKSINECNAEIERLERLNESIPEQQRLFNKLNSEYLGILNKYEIVKKDLDSYLHEEKFFENDSQIVLNGTGINLKG